MGWVWGGFSPALRGSRYTGHLAASRRKMTMAAAMALDKRGRVWRAQLPQKEAHRDVLGHPGWSFLKEIGSQQKQFLFPIQMPAQALAPTALPHNPWHPYGHPLCTCNAAAVGAGPRLPRSLSTSADSVGVGKQTGPLEVEGPRCCHYSPQGHLMPLRAARARPTSTLGYYAPAAWEPVSFPLPLEWPWSMAPCPLYC